MEMSDAHNHLRDVEPRAVLAETVALLHGRSAPTKVEKLFLAGDLLENNGGDPDCSVRGDRRVIGICAAKNA